MALRLNHAHHKVQLELNSVTHTAVPSTLKAFAKQRVRWCRGHLYNLVKYRDMIFNREYGFMGTFQFPLHILVPILAIVTVTAVMLSIWSWIAHTVWRALFATEGLFVMNIPTLKEFFLSLNVKVGFAAVILILLGIFMYHKAHHYAKERWKYPLTFLLFMTIYPPMLAAFWAIAIIEEIFKIKRRW